MFEVRGHRLRLTKGDYGEVMPISLAAHCDNCDDNLLEEDVVRLTVERGDVELIRRDVTLRELKDLYDGEYPFAIEKEETKLLDIGLYTWRARLLRHGHLRATLIAETLEVVP